MSDTTPVMYADVTPQYWLPAARLLREQEPRRGARPESRDVRLVGLNIHAKL